MADIERLNRALAHIEAHPEQHDQGVWLRKVDCGTAACLAGWVVIQEYPEAGFVRDRYDIGNTYSRVDILPEGKAPLVDEVAFQLLGITSDQADVLFDERNTIGHLKAMRDLLAADENVYGDELEAVRDEDDGE